jgi:hypothetical protein
LRMEYAKIYQVEEGSARREPLGGSLSEPSGLINALFRFLTSFRSIENFRYCLFRYRFSSSDR